MMQLTVQLESSDGQLQAQKRSLDIGIDEKNESAVHADDAYSQTERQQEKSQIYFKEDEKTQPLPIEAREKISSIAARGMAKNRMDRDANAMCDRSY